MDSISTNTFSDFNLSDEVKHAVADIGYLETTKIQKESIPLILEGNDIIGLSQTGSGKTAAFGLPAIDMVDLSLSVKMPQILILCPTRELAMQATDELHKFAKYKQGIRIVPVYGGQQIDRQIAAIRQGCQIIVGTPGRVMDHMRRKTLKFSQLKMVILDEADEMLDMGFREDIETILEGVPEDRQTILFSATMPKPILEITKQYQTNPKTVRIENKQLTVSTIEQSYFDVVRGKKNSALFLLLEYYQPKVALVFCNTKKMVDELVAELEKNGFSAQGLHGDMKQMQRTQVMNRFKSGGFNILVATDVAARGIDVNDIDIVFNYDLPADDEYYVHRIGRTGRAGKDGKSFSFIQGRAQLARLNEIMRYTKCTIIRKSLPKMKDIVSKNETALKEEIKSHINDENTKQFSETLMELIDEGFSLEQVATALLSMNVKKASFSDDHIEAFTENSHNERRSDRRRPSQGRNDRTRERKPNEKAMKKFADVDMESVRISIGRDDKVAPKHILGAVAGETGLPGKIMGSIDIHNDYTTIEVPKEFKTRVVKAMNKAQIKGKKVYAK